MKVQSLEIPTKISTPQPVSMVPVIVLAPETDKDTGQNNLPPPNIITTTNGNISVILTLSWVNISS